jgi:site-specific DNA-cytosine methylase
MFRKLFGSKKVEPSSPVVTPSETIHDLEQVASVLQASGYRVERLANKDFEGIPQERIRVFNGGIRFIITFDKFYFTFLDAYRLNGTFNHQNMMKWNLFKQLACFTYSGGADVAIVKHHMACGRYGVTDRAIKEFAKAWEEQMIVAFRKQNGLSLSDQV